MKNTMYEFKRYLGYQEFNIEDMDHYYKAESTFKQHNKAMLIRRMRTIAEQLDKSIFKLNSLTESKLDSDDNFKHLLVDFRHASLTSFPEGTRKAISEFWSIFDPKVKEFLEDERPSYEMENMIKMTHINSIRKSQVNDFFKEISFVIEDKPDDLQEFVTNSFDDSIVFMLDNLRDEDRKSTRMTSRSSLLIALTIR